MYLSNLRALLKVILTLIYPPASWLSSYLIAKQSGDAGFGGITYGSEVVTPLQGKHHPTACQSHQLPGQVAKAWTHRKWQQREGREKSRRKRMRWGEHCCSSSYFLFGYWSKKKERERGFEHGWGKGWLHQTEEERKRVHCGFTGGQKTSHNMSQV